MKRVVWLFAFAAMLLLTLRSRFRDRAGDNLEVTIRDRMCRPGNESWSAPGSEALVIIVSATCSACNASKSFDEEISDYGQAHGIPVFYVLSPKSENRARIAELTAAGRAVIREDPRAVGIFGLPTFLRVDDHGVVQSMWTGTIPESDHDAVFASLISGSSLQPYDRVPASAIPHYAADPGVEILALSATGRRPGIQYKTIPFSELSVRAMYELHRDLATVIDCGTSRTPLGCQQAAITLSKMRFKVAVAGLPARPNRCGT